MYNEYFAIARTTSLQSPGQHHRPVCGVVDE